MDNFDILKINASLLPAGNVSESKLGPTMVGLYAGSRPGGSEWGASWTPEEFSKNYKINENFAIIWKFWVFSTVFTSYRISRKFVELLTKI